MRNLVLKITGVIFLGFVLSVFTVPVFGEENGESQNRNSAISLQQAVRDGVKNHLGVLNSILEEEAFQRKRSIAENLKRFTVGLSGSYLFRSVQPELRLGEMISIPGLPFSIPDQTIGTKHTYDIAVSLKQPILTGGVLSSAVKMEEIRGTVQENQTELRKIEAAGLIKRSYLTWRLLQQKKESVFRLMDNLKLHNQRLNQYFEEDLVRKTDLLETEKRIQETLLNLADLDNAIESGKREFKRLCGHSPEDITEGYREEERSKEASLEYFLNSHPLIESLDRQMELAGIQEKMIKGRFSPQLFTFAELHLGRPGIDFFQNEWNVYFQGGITLSVPIFQWDKKKNELAVVDVQARMILNQKGDLLKEVEQNLDQLYISRLSILEKLEHIKNLIRLTEEDASLKKQLYEEGQLPNIDYLSALTVRERYQSLREELLFQLQIVYASINTLTGYSGGV
ncbi:TolC family protein [Acidobacteriota bacterium]